jgi:NitT/TauT family transport system ATP-binding protein
MRCSNSRAERLCGRYPWQLSGGMLQSANLCRALMHEPRSCFSTSRSARSTSSPAKNCGASLQALWMTQIEADRAARHARPARGWLSGERICVMSSRPGRILDDSAGHVCAAANVAK